MHNHNVEGTERVLSLAVGMMGMVSGIRQGGVGGLLKIAASAMIAKRGLTGHCRLKTLLEGQRPGADDAPAQQPQQAREPGATAASVVPHQESRIDNALEETFPASDPISP